MKSLHTLAKSRHVMFLALILGLVTSLLWCALTSDSSGYDHRPMTTPATDGIGGNLVDPTIPAVIVIGKRSLKSEPSEVAMSAGNDSRQTLPGNRETRQAGRL